MTDFISSQQSNHSQDGQSMGHDQLEEPDVCRVCRVEGDEDDPLIYPCKCSGSVRYVHPDCQKRYCEICGHKYTFTKVYPDYIPPSIPSSVYVRQSLLWLVRMSLLVMRFWLVVAVWLGLLPSVNMITLRTIVWLADAIIRPKQGIYTVADHDMTDQNDATVASHGTMQSDQTWKGLYSAQNNTLIGFIFKGQILSLAIAGVLLGLILVREWINQHNWTEHLQPAAEVQDEIDPDQWVIKRGVAIRKSIPESGHSGDSQSASSEQASQANASVSRPSNSPPMHVAYTPPEQLDSEEESNTAFSNISLPDEGENAAFLDLVRSLETEDDDDQRPHAAEPGPPLAVPAMPIVQAGADNLGPGIVEDANWEQEDWDGILEVVGLIGPLNNLVQNAIFAVIIMGATLTVLVGTPMFVGKIVLSLDILQTSMKVFRMVYGLVRKITDPVVDVIFEILREAVALPLLTSFHALEKITREKFHLPLHAINDVSHQDGVVKGFAVIRRAGFGILQSQRQWAHRIASSSAGIDRVWCILAGYTVAAITVILIAMAGETNLGRISTGLAQHIKQHGKFLKLALFMALEMVLFPIIAGTAIGLSVLPVFEDADLALRYSMFMSAPFATVFVNWIVGTSFMYAFSALLSHIRSIVRPGTIFFIRDPTDASFSPVKDILERSTLSQLRKLCVSALMYCFVIFALFGASSWTFRHQPWLPQLLPFRFKGRAPWTSVPLDLLFLQLIIPPTIRRLRPLHKAKRMCNAYWRTATHYFALSSLMYGPSRRALDEKRKGGLRALEWFWPAIDPLFRLMFGGYSIDATDARVPATDRVALLTQAERREHGVFIPLDAEGAPVTPQGHLAMLKQDRRAREKSRDPKQDYQVIWLPRYWRTRIHVFILTALFAMASTVALLVLGPLVVGRAALGIFTNRLPHDGYSYFAGAYICLLAAHLGRKVSRRISRSAYAERLRRSNTSTRFKRGLFGGLSTAYSLLTLYGVMPILVGLNLELYLSIPMRYGARLTIPVIHVWDAWSNGLMFLSLLLAIRRRRQRVRAGAQAEASPLHAMEQAYASPTSPSIRHLNRSIQLPVLGLLMAIFAPLMMTFVTVAISPSAVRPVIIYRLMYPACLGIVVYVCAGSLLRPKIERIRQKMVDAEYVVEERVENYNAGDNSSVLDKVQVIGDDNEEEWVDAETD